MKKLRLACWVLGAGLLLVPVFDDPPLWTSAYVQNVTPNRAVVAMITAEPCRLQLQVDGPGAVVEPPPRQPRRRHAIAVEELRPDTEYEYRVLDDRGALLDAGSFKTAPVRDDLEVRFCVVGDSGGLPWWVWMQQSPLFYLPARWHWLWLRSEVATIGERMAAERPHFWLHVGDVVYPRGQQRHYSPGFFRPFAELLRRSPCYAVLGNHDVMEDNGRQLLANLHLPANEITGDERLFSFAWGPVRVLGLDLNRRIEPGDPVLAFLDHELASATEPWIVALSHYPVWSASRQGDRPDLIEHVLPRLSRHLVDLYFAGHDHTYQRYPDAEGVALVVTGGGGKSLYALHEDPRQAVAASRYNYCAVEIRGPVLTLRAVGLDGEPIDTFSLRLADRSQAELARLAEDNPERLRRIQNLLR